MFQGFKNQYMFGFYLIQINLLKLINYIIGLYEKFKKIYDF
jgi:hypothetical protein